MTIEELWEQYHLPIYKYTHYKLGDCQQAEDATQDIFLKAMCHLSSLPEQRGYKSWLYRIATNHCIDLLRHGSILHFAEIEPGHAVGDLPDIGMQEDISYALARLPKHYRQALILYYHHGYSIEEIARSIGYQPSGMKMLLKRARAAFQGYYHGREEQEEAA